MVGEAKQRLTNEEVAGDGVPEPAAAGKVAFVEGRWGHDCE